MFVITLRSHLKDVRSHWYCTSLVRTLYMTWRVPRHVFQARAPSRNSTKYRADDLCGNFICEYFCWMHGDPHFFRQITSLCDSFHYTKKKKILYVTIQIGSNRPFPSSLVPLFHKEAKCETILMKMTLICMKMKLHAELIFIWKVSHLDSFWSRDTRELGNGLLVHGYRCARLRSCLF